MLFTTTTTTFICVKITKNIFYNITSMLYIWSQKYLYFSPIFLIISSYMVHAKADIKARLNILGANPIKNPLGPASASILRDARKIDRYTSGWICILVLTTSAGWVTRLDKKPANIPQEKCVMAWATPLLPLSNSELKPRAFRHFGTKFCFSCV